MVEIEEVHALILWLKVLNAIQVAEKAEKPGLEEIFTDVYDAPPSNLRDQEKWLRQTVERHQQDYTHF